MGAAQFGLDYGIANQMGKIQLSKAQSIVDFAKRNVVRSIDMVVFSGENK